MRAILRLSLLMCLLATLVPSDIVSAAEAERGWIDSPLYHRYVSKPDDADGCVYEQWTVKTDPLYQYEDSEYLPQPICVYHAKDYSYSINRRLRTVRGANIWTYESRIAVAKGSDIESRTMVPVENGDYAPANGHLHLNNSNNFILVSGTETGFGSYLYIQSDLRESLHLDSSSGLYTVSGWGDRLTDPAGQPLRVFGYGSSENGEWLAVVTGGSFIKHNVSTGARGIVANKNFYSTNIWPRQLYSTFITNDGKIMGYLGHNTESIILSAEDRCVDPPVGPSSPYDSALYTTCRYRDLYSFMADYTDPTGPYSGGVRWYASPQLEGSILKYKDSINLWHEISPNNFSGVQYLALGDSFASGEGDLRLDNTDPYLHGTNIYGDYRIGVPREMCHISKGSYPLLIANSMSLARGSDAHSVACSGAVVGDIYSGTAANGFVDDTYMGQYTQSTDWNIMKPRLEGIANASGLQNDARTNILSGRVQQIEHLKKTQPYYATIMAGGNDMKFGDVMTACATNARLGIDQSCKYATAEGRKEQASIIRNSYSSLLDLYKTAIEASPNTKFFVIGYPQFFDTDTLYCKETLGAYAQVERQSLFELTEYANATIRAAANDAGLVYVDISGALRGQELCGKTTAMSGVDNLVGAKIYTELMRSGDTVLSQSVFDRLAFPTKSFLNSYEINRGLSQIDKLNYSPYTAIYGAMQQYSHPNAVGHQAIYEWMRLHTDGELLATDNCNEVVVCASGQIVGAPSPEGYIAGLTLGDGEIIINGEGIVSVGRSFEKRVAHGVVVLKKAGKVAISIPGAAVTRWTTNLRLRVSIHSAPIDIGALTYDQLRDVYELESALDDSIAVGQHTVYVEGVADDGKKIMFVRDIFIEGPQGDVDDDGASDDVDSCAFSSAETSTLCVFSPQNEAGEQLSSKDRSVPSVGSQSLPLLNIGATAVDAQPVVAWFATGSALANNTLLSSQHQVAADNRTETPHLFHWVAVALFVGFGLCVGTKIYANSRYKK